jgi:hypothetical protein
MNSLMKMCSRCFRYSSIPFGTFICERCANESLPEKHLNLVSIDKDKFAAMTSDGLLLTKEDWTLIKIRLDKFYQYKSYEDIDQINKEITQKKARYKEELSGIERYIYVFGTRTGYYKIGLANDVQKRLSGVQSNCPLKLSVVHYFSCEKTKSIESRLHAVFLSKKTTGEWFSLSRSDIKWIQTLYDGITLFQLERAISRLSVDGDENSHDKKGRESKNKGGFL